MEMVFNSIVITPDAKFMTLGISNMYLNTPLREYQYMTFNIINMVPQEIIDHHNLHNKVLEDGRVYYKINNTIYGLKEVGKLADLELQAVLATKGYKPC